MANLLIIDDDPKICHLLSQLVVDLEHEASVANTLKDGLDMVSCNNYDLVLLDLEFPEGNGLQILPDIFKVQSRPEVIIITGTGGVGGAETAFKYGAWDYVQKPFVLHEVSLPISRALQYRQEKDIAKTPFEIKRGGIVGSSPALNCCLNMVAKASATDASVLISGETGTGKELFARAIHDSSKRSSGNFVIVDCAALPETLSEGILFGHEKGAFTGADKSREGLVAQADKGTLFLDEIGDLPLNTQKNLLRCLQEKRIMPLGAKQEISVDFRLVAATNRVLDKMVEADGFREDLLYRIRTIEIKLPPLRDRGEDIQEIIIKKIHQLAHQYNIATKGMSPEFLEILQTQSWPGNVRELINTLEYALASAGKDPTLFPMHLPTKYRAAKYKNKTHWNGINGVLHNEDMPDAENTFPTLSDYREEIEKKYLQMLLEMVHGDRNRACQLSGISQSRLYGLLKKYALARFK